MAIAKRPLLATHYTGPRAAARDVVSLAGTCKLGEGEEHAVSVLDLDTRGCRISGFTATVTKAAEIELRLGTFGPIAARLRWAKRGSAGLKFDAELTDEQLAEAERSAVPAASRVVPLRRPAASDGET